MENRAPSKAHADDEPFSLLADDGSTRTGAPSVPDEAALALYRAMLQVRLVDERMTELQRAGRISFYLTSSGEEAAQLGAAYALRAGDWIFPSFRDAGMFFWRGFSLAEFVNQLFGNAGDACKGRQMPMHHSAARLNLVSISSPAGTQIPQATGMAMAARKLGRDDVALASFGDGASAAGQFHVGLNFGAVFKAPVVFVCRTRPNELAQATASRSIAVKAHAYGVPAARVDGCDLLAVIAAVEDAVARARARRGPSLIEAVTGRGDPLARWRRHLEHRGILSQATHDECARNIAGELDDAISNAEKLGPPSRETLFEDVFKETPK